LDIKQVPALRDQVRQRIVDELDRLRGTMPTPTAPLSPPGTCRTPAAP
jgi:hypothetical protein